jgi:uncharacterized protein (DUF433 family)
MIAPHITMDEQGRPWVEGTNTKVIEVVSDYLAYGWSPEEMHRHHPHLPLVKLYAAMAYYFDHQAEIDAEIARDLKQIAQMRAAAGESPFIKRMRLAGKLS